MCGRPVFVLVVGAAVCCMLNKGALRWGTKKDKPLFNIQLLGLWFEPFVQWYQSPLPQQPKTNWSNCNTFTQTFFWGFSKIHGSSFCLYMATLVKSTFMGLRKPKLECCTNRFQYLAFASPVRVLNSMLWWHFGFKFCALAPWSVNFQTHPAAHPTRNLHQLQTKEDNIHFVILRRITSTPLTFNLPPPSENGEVRQQPQFGKKVWPLSACRSHSEIAWFWIVVQYMFTDVLSWPICFMFDNREFLYTTFIFRWQQRRRLKKPCDDVSLSVCLWIRCGLYI